MEPYVHGNDEKSDASISKSLQSSRCHGCTFLNILTLRRDTFFFNVAKSIIHLFYKCPPRVAFWKEFSGNSSLQYPGLEVPGDAEKCDSLSLQK